MKAGEKKAIHKKKKIDREVTEQTYRNGFHFHSLGHVHTNQIVVVYHVSKFGSEIVLVSMINEEGWGGLRDAQIERTSKVMGWGKKTFQHQNPQTGECTQGVLECE